MPKNYFVPLFSSSSLFFHTFIKWDQYCPKYSYSSTFFTCIPQLTIQYLDYCSYTLSSFSLNRKIHFHFLQLTFILPYKDYFSSTNLKLFIRVPYFDSYWLYQSNFLNTPSKTYVERFHDCGSSCFTPLLILNLGPAHSIGDVQRHWWRDEL